MCMCRFALFVFFVTVCSVAVAKFEDRPSDETRCHCVCTCPHANDKVADKDTLKCPLPTYRQDAVPEDCSCKEVVPEKYFKENPDIEKSADNVDKLCGMCDCRYQARNTSIIKVVIIIVICLVSFLVLYMLVLLFLDPVFKQYARAGRSTANNPYARHTDEGDDDVGFAGADNIFNAQQACSSENNHNSSPPSSPSRAAPITQPRSRSGTTVLDKVADERHKWIQQVAEQRRNIFTDHTMLN